MIQINLVARIAADKNSFLDLVYLAHKLKQANFNKFIILFIGAIESTDIYQNIIRTAESLGVAANISFTERSIPLATLADDVKDGYFFNFTVGNFMGYSSVESINLGFKTIFCNTDKRIVNKQYNYINMCPDIDAAINLILLISQNPDKINEEIMRNNVSMKNAYMLNSADASLLRSLMLPTDSLV